MNIPHFKTFRIHNDTNSGYRSGIENLSLADLSPGEILIKTAYSSVNYKDALAGTGQGKILRQFPLNGGIDVAGTVVESSDVNFKPGDEVLCTGCGLSETRDGGYSEYARLQSKWSVKLPLGLSLRESMILGTAGFTAALALYRMLQNGQSPELGPIAVTGATGGVGMLATDIFTRAGFEVHALSGKPEHAEFLTSIGAKQVLPREAALTSKPMDSAKFGGALDNVGGTTLSGLLAQTAPYGNVASAGLVASHEIPTTVMPFIIRGVSLLGIASAGTARRNRDEIWEKLAVEWKPAHINAICTREVTMDQLPGVFATMLAGRSFGRTIVKL
ncbi:MAG: YhdH/YhfP family quinone oxidoreductase [Arenimonas sp.]